MERKYTYNNPKQNIERMDNPIHTLELHDENGTLLGGADLMYFSKPVPYYQITDMWVEYDQQGNGHASAIMARIEEILKKKGKAGFLVDAIDPGNQAKGMYERRGWIPVPGGYDQFVFNLPSGVLPDRFIGIHHRGTAV